MSIQILMALTIGIPILAGLILLLLSVLKTREGIVKAVAVVGLALTLCAAAGLLILYFTGRITGDASGEEAALTIINMSETLRIRLSLDGLGAFFLMFIPVIFLLGGVFSLEYLKHEQCRKRFWGFYLLTLGALMGLSLSGNLVTVYFFFEMMSLVSMPLVLHAESHEAIMAALKYLFYSMAGSYMALFGVFLFCHYGAAADFAAGGLIPAEIWSENSPLLLLSIFLMIVGFGAKGGLFPMHSWLPTAHPVAPAPASAVLSAIIVKGGVLAVMRSVFYVAGAAFIQGTWVQIAWIILSLITIFMGSMLAYKEPVIKKRLAYSTVSQVSYIFLGLAMLDVTSITGSLLHILFHAILKTALFLSAGAIIFKTGHTRVDELKGIGKEMPVTIWCYTIAALGLIGIPPVCGFLSKWDLAVGMLNSGMSVFSWLGPVLLLVSALLTAGYLLPVSIQGFLPGNDYDYSALKKREPALAMTVPLVILAAAAVLLGVFPGVLTDFLSQIALAIVP